MDIPAQSIDAIVQTAVEDLSANTLEPQDVSSELQSHPNDLPVASQKHRNRRRLLLGLHRISSSPSLVKMRPYKSSNRASMSCVSLTSSLGEASCSSIDSELTQQFSTAPTSVSNSPGPATPTFDHRPRARTLTKDVPTCVALPQSLRPASPGPTDTNIAEGEEDYFSCSATDVDLIEIPRSKHFNFWNDMPSELRIQILSFLKPREIIRCSSVSRAWREFCYDGQLWSNLDTSEYYRDVPGNALTRIICNAGPFVRDLNLRGCIQLKDRWSIANACKNLENFSLEGCNIEMKYIHSFLEQNSRLVHINIAGLAGVTNRALKLIAQQCPKLEFLNITWCQHVDTRGIRKVVEACANLKDLRAGETRGWDDTSIMLELFQRNSLERLVLTNCDTISDESLSALIVGINGEMDWLTGRIICPPRKLKHLDLTRCRNITDDGLRSLAHNLPVLEGLQLSKCVQISDSSLTEILPTFPRLTHIDLEELEGVTNATLDQITASPAARSLRHLNVSYCESITDAAMVPLIKTCKKLERIDMDNTRISDLCLVEAAILNAERNRNNAYDCPGTLCDHEVRVGLRLVVYDCPNVTWMGVREILSRNTDIARTPISAASRFTIAYSSSTEPRHSCSGHVHLVVALKAFYTWQPTINEHAKRVMNGDFERARRLERKWAEFMMLGEEAAQGGRRRRRRMREALEAMAGEEGIGDNGAGMIRRRRARSAPLGGANGCVVM